VHKHAARAVSAAASPCIYRLRLWQEFISAIDNPAFVQSVLSNLPGVDANDPRVLERLKKLRVRVWSLRAVERACCVGSRVPCLLPAVTRSYCVTAPANATTRHTRHAVRALRCMGVLRLQQPWQSPRAQCMPSFP
jgi:hypothetical protein